MCTIATDAVTDAMCRARRVYLQPVAKIAGVASTAVVLAQSRWASGAAGSGGGSGPVGLGVLGLCGGMACVWAGVLASRLETRDTLVAVRHWPTLPAADSISPFRLKHLHK